MYRECVDSTFFNSSKNIFQLKKCRKYFPPIHLVHTKLSIYPEECRSIFHFICECMNAQITKTNRYFVR